MRPNSALAIARDRGTNAIGAATGVSCDAAPDLQRGEDAVHLAADGRARHDDQPVLAVPVGDEIDVAGLVGHRDQAVLGEVGVEALGLAEDEAR